jgi:hypothetical protein
MAGTNGHHETSPEYWVAYLAAAIGGALVTQPFEVSKAALKDALRRFTKSQACSSHLRDEIAAIGRERT